jgi:hypothetical protein
MGMSFACSSGSYVQSNPQCCPKEPTRKIPLPQTGKRTTKGREEVLREISAGQRPVTRQAAAAPRQSFAFYGNQRFREI